MAGFEIISIDINKGSFQVEVELPNRTRRKFGYPMGDGWETEIGGKPKFINDILSKLEMENQIIASKTKEIESLRIKLINKKFK